MVCKYKDNHRSIYRAVFGCTSDIFIQKVLASFTSILIEAQSQEDNSQKKESRVEKEQVKGGFWCQDWS